MGDVAAEWLRSRGIDPDGVAAPPEPAFDPVAWRLEQAERALSAQVPIRYRQAKVSHPEVREWVNRVVADPNTAPSLLLAGAVGVGKTWQAYGALMAMVLEAANQGRTLTWAAVTHAGVNDAVRPGRGGPDALSRYEQAEVLLLDDLGAAYITEWNADVAYRLIDTRWTNCRPTIVTTNLNPGDLESALGQRLVSRLFGMSRTVVLKGNDRRREVRS